MKRRLLALLLTIILALTLVVPALMEGGGVPLPTESTVKTLPDNYFVKLPASGSSIMSPAPYAIITAADWVKDTFKISWKTFVAKDVMLNGCYDVSKLITGVKKESYLVIPQDGTIVTTGKQEVLTASKMASLSSLISSGSKVEIYRLLEPAKKPAVPKPTFVDENNKTFAIYAFTGTTATMEYQKLGAASWTSIADNTMKIELEEYKVEYYVRADGVGTATSVSASVKVTVPALANAPTTKLDVSKGEIKLKKDWQVRVASSPTSVITLAAAKTLAIGDKTDIDNGTISRTESYIEFRVPSGKKAGSTWSRLYLNVGKGDVLDNNKVGNYFTFAAKNTVTVVGSIPIQAKINNKWKNVKSIKYSDFALTDKNGTLEVRMAGTKTKLPGASSILKINATGELSLEAAPTT